MSKTPSTAGKQKKSFIFFYLRMRNNDNYKFVYLFKVFPPFSFFVNIQQGSTQNGSKMKKFLHLGMVIVIVVLFFCVKCDENKKALFLKSYLCCLNIYGYNQQNPKIERKNKKRNVGRNFGKNDDYWQNDGIMHE